MPQIPLPVIDNSNLDQYLEGERFPADGYIYSPCDQRLLTSFWLKSEEEPGTVATMTPAPTLAARGVSKSFFGNPVLRDVSIALQPGRIHALLGENGAGKSTPINILSGALLPEEGVVEIDGRSFRGLNPRDAHRAGVAVVQQELGLTSQLSIAENIGLGALPRRYGLIGYRGLAKRARAAMDLVGLDEDLATPVGDLPLGRRQKRATSSPPGRRPPIAIRSCHNQRCRRASCRICWRRERRFRRSYNLGGRDVVGLLHGIGVASCVPIP
jgi:ABC-type multidrug transport system fused ATPase/permease subunit